MTRRPEILEQEGRLAPGLVKRTSPLLKGYGELLLFPFADGHAPRPRFEVCRCQPREVLLHANESNESARWFPTELASFHPISASWKRKTLTGLQR